MTAINLPISCAEVYWCIADSESINSQEISEKTGLAKSTVQGHLSVLEKRDAIKSQDLPKQYCVSDDISSETLDWLKEFEELARATRGLKDQGYVVSDIAATKAVFDLQGQIIYFSANENSGLEPPPEESITRAELKTAFRQVRRIETYMGHLLSYMPCVKDNKLAWCCDIDLAIGKRFHGSNSKSFDSVDEALNWAKRIIDEADTPFNNEGQGLVDSSNAALSYLISSADAMLQKYLPTATHSHSLVLKYLLKQFQNQGTDAFWDYFLARGFALTSRKFLSICRDLAKSGLIRYSRYTAAYMMDCYLGPAWLSLEGVVLQEQELQAIAIGEQVASYHPWRKSNESYPGEKYGFPCMEQSECNIAYFYEGLGMSAKWTLRQQGNILVRVPVNPHYLTWYSTWQDGFWTHRSSDFVKEDSPENSEWFGRGAAMLGLTTTVGEA